MACLHHFSSCCNACLHCSSWIRLEFHFPMSLVASGQLATQSFFFFVACGRMEAITPRLCIAQQAHGNPAIATMPPASLCSPLYLSVAALKSPTEFHDPRKKLDSTKVNFSNGLFWMCVIGCWYERQNLGLSVYNKLQMATSLSSHQYKLSRAWTKDTCENDI